MSTESLDKARRQSSSANLAQNSEATPAPGSAPGNAPTSQSAGAPAGPAPASPSTGATPSSSATASAAGAAPAVGAVATASAGQATAAGSQTDLAASDLTLQSPLDDIVRAARTLLLVGFIGTLPLVYFAAFTETLDATRAALWVLGVTAISVVMFAAIALARTFARELLAALHTDGPPRFERHWGGLGGSVGGWSMSRSLVSLFALLLALAALIVALSEVKVLSGFLLNQPPPSEQSEPGDGSGGQPSNGDGAAQQGAAESRKDDGSKAGSDGEPDTQE